VSRLAAIRRG